MKVFMRSTTWISPVVAAKAAAHFTDISDGAKQFAFTEKDIERFKQEPDFHLKVRKEIEGEINAGYDAFLLGSDLARNARNFMETQMKQRLGARGEILAEKLIPSWAPGCRRITPGDGYLEALTQDNVEPIFGEIARISETGLHMKDGTFHEVDILICATGFDVSYIPSFEIEGEGGETLSERWKDYPDSYLGLATPGFPNYFIICGPQGPVGNGSIIPALEVLCAYFIEVMKKMQLESIKSLEPKRRVTDQFQQHMVKYHRGTVWSQPCKSWYKNGTVDGQPHLWCGSTLHYLKTVLHPRYEDFVFEYKEGNQWAFLGNGKTKEQALLVPGETPDFNALTPYIRNDDREWHI